MRLNDPTPTSLRPTTHRIIPVKLGQLWTREILPGVFRLGTTYVGCYAVEDAGAFTFVDTGLPN